MTTHKVSVICQQCGKTFEVFPSQFKTAKYCSDSCRYQNRKIKLNCKWCGKPFEVFKGRANTAQYCSRSCLASSKVGPRHPKWVGREFLICKNCGKEYPVTTWEKNRSRSHFCSKSCGNSFNQRGSKSHLWKGGPKTRMCPNCGKEFTTPSNRSNKYCSKRCWIDHYINSRVPVTCPDCGKISMRRPSETHIYCNEKCYRGQKSSHPNTIEKAIQDGLTAQGISFIPEYFVKPYYIDIFIPDHQIAIECDGEYWHRDRTEHDAKKTTCLSQKGIKVIRFPEDQIRNNLPACIAQVLSAIDTH